MANGEEQYAELMKKQQARDEWLRESWIRAMEARIVSDNLQKCHRVEGVNHYEKCKHLADRYQEMLRDNRVKGFKTIDV
ncbi:hypothetical protein EIP91_005212 [Steccherinum ochraceum]|uniref:NADH-ubiquinone oxidoreductase 12 kDa subunit n=1 Tax=Steccherinum ochraceum TaxID=92696 RepID=A0A4R0RAB1_9APHY|nr:hypothetical protein EIP91_005212 [Steccherinum ochraceum]